MHTRAPCGLPHRACPPAPAERAPPIPHARYSTWRQRSAYPDLGAPHGGTHLSKAERSSAGGLSADTPMAASMSSLLGMLDLSPTRNSETSARRVAKARAAVGTQ
eukprot:6377621-Prymnesium_polylepis.1